MRKNNRKVNKLCEKKKENKKVGGGRKVVKKRLIGKPEYNKPIQQIKKHRLS